MFRYNAYFAAALLACATLAQAEDPKPLKILLVCGGCCHDYANQKNIIQTGLEERAHVEVTVVHQGGSATNSKIELYEKEGWAKGYDLVIHDECFADVKEKEWVDQILKPHREGLPGVVIHCAMHCYRTGADDWFEFCGVTSRRHGAAYPHEVLNRDAEHPVMKKFGAGWANPAGELYWIEKVWDTAHPLAASKNKENGKEEVCVWTNQYRDKTRVFGTTLGHHNETVRAPEFLEMLTRGCLWSMDKLEDKYLKARKPKVVPVNLCLGKKATASSEEKGKGNLAANAIDGKSETRWCANGPEKNEWLQIDLGKKETLTGGKLVWENSEAVYTFTVEGSADAKDWKMLADGSKNDKPGTNDLKFDAKDIQYVRVTMLANTRFNWASLWEVELHGTETMEVAAATGVNPEEKALLADVKVPEGFEATLFAAPPAVGYPVSVAAAPDGVVYVAVDKNGSLDRATNRGSIYRLRDVDGDGRADETKLFVSNVDSPRGLVWDHDRLYVMHPPHVSAFIDRDGDGISEEQQVLVKDIAFTFKDRPADHTSNGVTLGIDGWLYLAIGDFGFLKAEGTDGRTLQLRGGGVVRVRPDGTELELYSRGTRNILEVSMDPLLNGFARDNTNDGGGWDIRLHHFSGMEDHGYPRLYMNFGDEIVKPLADYGGGSGCGGMYLDEPGFPAGYGNALYTCDWGRNWIYRHNLKPKGATFEADQHEAFGLTRVTDLDCDALSHLYAASWKGATFNYAGENVGYIARISPKGYEAKPLPNYAKAKDAELVQELLSPSHRRRLEAQRTLLRRGLSEDALAQTKTIAGDVNAPLASRVAAIFLIKQALGTKANGVFLELVQDDTIRQYVTRAMFDRIDENKVASCQPIMRGLRSKDAGVRLATLVALARRGRQPASADGAMTPLLIDEDPLVAHTAVQALVSLTASKACLQLIEARDTGPNLFTAALRVLSAIHEPEVVDGLLAQLGNEEVTQRRSDLLAALCRLYNTEGEWKGDSWGTRPDTSGPYYQPVAWSESPKILETLTGALAEVSDDEAANLLREMSRNKVKVDGLVEKLVAIATKNDVALPTLTAELVRSGSTPDAAVPLLLRFGQTASITATQKADVLKALAKSTSSAAKEAVAALSSAKPMTLELPPSSGPLVETMSADEAVAAVLKAKGIVEVGEILFTKLDCVKCHTVKADEPVKGPFLGTIANTYKRKELAEAIVLPSKTLAQGFVTTLVHTSDGKQITGFIVQEAADKITLRDAKANEIVIPVDQIEEREKLKVSIMPDGLAQKLTIEQLASLVDYIESLPKK